MLCLSYIFVFICNCICTSYLYTWFKVPFICSKAMWRDAGMQITIKIEAGLQFSAKRGSARQIAHIFCRQQFARLDVEFLPTMFQHSRTDLKCNQSLSDMEVDVPPIKLCPNAPDFALYEFGMVTSTVPVFTAVQCTRPLCDWAGLRLWNGHKVTISPSVGDSDGSIRRLLKSKNGAKTRTNIYWRSDTNFYFSFHCIFLKTL